jgi:N-acetylglucosaminyldiphosphoundecaprenol N-acetyl-beta-D-mannosaminyltransferase
VLGVGISVLNIPTTIELLRAAVAEGRRGYVTVTGVHGVMESQDDPRLLSIHNESLLSTPDGMPMVWLGRRAGYPEMDRVYGPDLFEAIMDESVRTGWTHYFYGGAEGVAHSLREKVRERHPGVKVVGAGTPPFRHLSVDEERALEAELASLRPDFFWVGMSMPKQEWFMAKYHDRLDAKIMLGVGAVFDFYTGRVKQAPRWIQRSGFEWLYRMAREPRRLARRYLRNNPRFVWRILCQLTGLRRYPPVPGEIKATPG